MILYPGTQEWYLPVTSTASLCMYSAFCIDRIGNTAHQEFSVYLLFKNTNCQSSSRRIQYSTVVGSIEPKLHQLRWWPPWASKDVLDHEPHEPELVVVRRGDLDVPLGPVARAGRRVHRHQLAQGKHHLQANLTRKQCAFFVQIRPVLR